MIEIEEYRNDLLERQVEVLEELSDNVKELTEALSAVGFSNNSNLWELANALTMLKNKL